MAIHRGIFIVILDYKYTYIYKGFTSQKSWSIWKEI